MVSWCLRGGKCSSGFLEKLTAKSTGNVIGELICKVENGVPRTGKSASDPLRTE